MSGCCDNHKEKTRAEDNQKKVSNEKPKSPIKKYLYNLGKKEEEKEKKSQGGCC